MQRRTLLRVGMATGALLALAGAGLALSRPGLRGGKLTAAGREVFQAVARAVLQGSLPTEPALQTQALLSHLDRLDETISGFPAAVRDELAEMTTLLAHPAGRVALAGLSTAWPEAGTPQLQAVLQALRESKLAIRQQVYHALRDLTNAAFFSDPSTWPSLGYPGPMAVQQ